MNIKRYTMASALLIMLVGWYVYAYITQEKMSIDFFGTQLPNLSIFLWVILPIVVLYIFSVLHMTFHQLVAIFRLRKFKKDAEKMSDCLADAYLGKKDRHFNFKTPRYQLFGSLLDNSTLIPNDRIPRNTSDEKINKVLNDIADIKDGKVVELKAYNLPADNELVAKNNENKYREGKINAETVLSSSDDFSKEFCTEVYNEYIKIASFVAINKHKKFMTKESLKTILNRLSAKDNNLEITNEEIIILLDNLELDAKDYIDVSLVLANKMDPELRIQLFKEISSANEVAMDAYLYTLLDLEMIGVASEILDNSQAGEFLKFKAYMELKDSSNNYNISLFI